MNTLTRAIFPILAAILCFSARGGEPFYKYPKLKDMPLEVQEVFTESFKRLRLERALVGPGGSRLLGINMLFTDKFFVSKVGIKYDVQGEFKLNKSYRFKKFSVTHFDYHGKTVAIFFKNIDQSSIEVFKKILAKVKAPKTSSLFSPIASAYADTCHRPDIGPRIPVDSALAEGSTAALITQCFSGMGEGVEESTVGFGRSIMNGLGAIGAEAKRLWDNPRARLGTYANFVGEGVDLLWDFSKTLGRMIIDPAYGARLLKEKFGEIGGFFAEVYDNIKSMPLAAKVDVICNIIGAIGVDILISAITVGAASGKLGVTVARLLFKLKKISSLAGKGIAYPFKLLKELGEDSIARLEKIIKAGKRNLLERKMRRAGCAL